MLRSEKKAARAEQMLRSAAIPLLKVYIKLFLGLLSPFSKVLSRSKPRRRVSGHTVRFGDATLPGSLWSGVD